MDTDSDEDGEATGLRVYEPGIEIDPQLAAVGPCNVPGCGGRLVNVYDCGKIGWHVCCEYGHEYRIPLT